ncbi:MAG: DUF3574 domain-containing protein [Pseudomonadota bacterium]|nr:DUF3574 domain-containing protein [Pseudomonadota bacterium]
MIAARSSVKQHIRIILPLCLGILLPGCASLNVHDARSGQPVALTLCQKGEILLHRSTLYFGASRPGGVVVDAVQWGQFLTDVVTPAFPDGLTWFDAQGQWRGSSNRVEQEHARLIVLLHAGDAATQSRVDLIAESYKRVFAQESVLQERAAVCARF